MEQTDNSQDVKVCRGDCLQCSLQQRIYCSAQMARNNVEVLAEMSSRLDSMEKAISEIHGKVLSIQQDGAELIRPFEKDIDLNIAQEASGADNRLP